MHDRTRAIGRSRCAFTEFHGVYLPTGRRAAEAPRIRGDPHGNYGGRWSPDPALSPRRRWSLRIVCALGGVLRSGGAIGPTELRWAVFRRTPSMNHPTSPAAHLGGSPSFPIRWPATVLRPKRVIASLGRASGTAGLTTGAPTALTMRPAAHPPLASRWRRPPPGLFSGPARVTSRPALHPGRRYR
jgi:hypothetical protein